MRCMVKRRSVYQLTKQSSMPAKKAVKKATKATVKKVAKKVAKKVEKKVEKPAPQRTGQRTWANVQETEIKPKYGWEGEQLLKNHI